MNKDSDKTFFFIYIERYPPLYNMIQHAIAFLISDIGKVSLIPNDSSNAHGPSSKKGQR